MSVAVIISWFLLSCLVFLSKFTNGGRPASWAGCGEPGTPFDGERNISGTLENVWATYACKKNKILIGQPIRKCFPNETTWSPQQIPRCVSNLAYNKKARHRAESVRFSFSVDGDAATCDSQAGQFYGSIDLGQPTVFDKLNVTMKSKAALSVNIFVTNDTDVQLPTFNNTGALQHFCSVDNVLLIKPVTCGLAEVASRFVVIHLSKPADVCEVTVHNSKELTPCGTPDLPPHGRIGPSGDVVYECEPGFRLTGSTVVSCVNGSWIVTHPQCISMISDRTTSIPTSSSSTETNTRPHPGVTGVHPTSRSQPHAENKDQSTTMGIMGIALGATSAFLVSFILFYFIRK